MLFKWNDFVNIGDDVSDELFAARVKNIAPNKCASLIYTVIKTLLFVFYLLQKGNTILCLLVWNHWFIQSSDDKPRFDNLFSS